MPTPFLLIDQCCVVTIQGFEDCYPNQHVPQDLEDVENSPTCRFFAVYPQKRDSRQSRTMTSPQESFSSLQGERTPEDQAGVGRSESGEEGGNVLFKPEECVPSLTQF